MNLIGKFVLALAIAIPPVATTSSALNANEQPEEIVVEPPAEVERWFAALGSVNKREFQELIKDDAMIVLKDLGIEQTKDEFIEALAEWHRLTRDANIIYRYEAIEDGSATALVCYRFKSNEQLNIERFTFSGEQITGSVQELKGETCEDF